MKKNATIRRRASQSATRRLEMIRGAPSVPRSAPRMGQLITAPVASARSASGIRPQISRGGSRGGCGIRVAHTEYLMDLATTGTGFVSTLYPIQPGVGTLFPWLSVIASRFNRYRFNRLNFLYEAKCSSQSSGSVILAADSDASDPVPATKSEICSYQMFKDTVPWVSETLNCPAADLNANLPFHFVRTGIIANTDIKTYDSGNFILSTSGIATGTYGELYVSYDIELDTPILTDSIGGTLTSSGTCTAANPLSPAAAVSGILPFTVANSTLTFTQQFEGVLTLFASGTPGAFTVATGTSTESILNYSTTSAATVMYAVKVRALIGQTFVWTSANAPTGSYLLTTACPYDAC